MKTRKLLTILTVVCLILFCACTKEKENAITGDVKQDIEKDTVTLPETSGDEQLPEVDIPEVDVENEEPAPSETEPKTVGDYISEFGAYSSSGGEYTEDADIFAEAIKSANKVIVAEYTGGFDEYYSFLDHIKINSYSIYPFDFSQEQVDKVLENSELYYNHYDYYLVDFDVAVGDGEHFKEGSNLYMMAFGQDPIAGGPLSEFVPAEKALDFIFQSMKKDLGYNYYFIREFLALYRGELFEGKNYPESFDFTDSVHLITHLMTRCSKYREYPPYSMDEINEFISLSFDANQGLNLTEARDFENWMTGASYAVTDEDRENDRLYGCSWGHGGTTAEHSFDSIEYDGENTKYSLTLYADYAHFAKSKTITVTLEEKEGTLPKMTLLTVESDTGRPIAYVSV